MQNIEQHGDVSLSRSALGLCTQDSVCQMDVRQDGFGSPRPSSPSPRSRPERAVGYLAGPACSDPLHKQQAPDMETPHFQFPMSQRQSPQEAWRRLLMPEGDENERHNRQGGQACARPAEWSASCPSRLSLQQPGPALCDRDRWNQQCLPAYIHPWSWRGKEVPGTGGFSISPRGE